MDPGCLLSQAYSPDPGCLLSQAYSPDPGWLLSQAYSPDPGCLLSQAYSPDPGCLLSQAYSPDPGWLLSQAYSPDPGCLLSQAYSPDPGWLLCKVDSLNEMKWINFRNIHVDLGEKKESLELTRVGWTDVYMIFYVGSHTFLTYRGGSTRVSKWVTRQYGLTWVTCKQLQAFEWRRVDLGWQPDPGWQRDQPKFM